MHTDYWIKRWHEGKTGFHQDAINPNLKRHINDLSLNKGELIFVPLCGKSQDMLWLIQQGYRVIGIEVSQLAIEQFFETNNLQATSSQQGEFIRYQYADLTILCGDFFSLNRNDLAQVKAVYDRASLIALSGELRLQYLAKMDRLFAPSIETLLISMSYPKGEMDGPPFSLDHQEILRLYAPRQITLLRDQDVLKDNAHFKKRGLTEMSEQVYRIGPN